MFPVLSAITNQNEKKDEHQSALFLVILKLKFIYSKNRLKNLLNVLGCSIFFTHINVWDAHNFS